MDTPRITLILHGCRWPEAPAVAEIGACAREAFGSAVEIVEAREGRRRACGASALVNRAASGASGRVLLAAEPSVAWTPADFASVAGAAEEALALADQAPRCRLWGMRRDAFDEVGRLDARLWSVGEVEDLEARARASGFAVSRVAVGGAWRGPEAYPLRSAAGALLRIRNPLITAFKTEPAARLGPLLAESGLASLLEASRRASFDPAAFGFEKARPGPLPAMRPADEAGALVPLLALDSFLRELPGLLNERERYVPTGRGPKGVPPPGRPGGPDAGDLVAALVALVEAGR